MRQAYRELERWRERQFDEYLHAEVIDRLDRQRLLDEYQRAQVADRMDQQVSSLSQLARSLAGVDSSAAVMQADLARLATVAGSALPAIVEHVALAARRLGGVEQLLASPQETAAAELARGGGHALATATELLATGSPGSAELAAEWLEQAVSDLSRSVETPQYRPEPWHLLAMALKAQGDHEAAVRAYSRCALYAILASPRLAAWAVLMAAATLRKDLSQPVEAAALLRRYCGQLDRCAEIHLALAVHHGEPAELVPALRLAPILAADARAEARAAGVELVELVEHAAAQVCQEDDSPVARLRRLEEQVVVLGTAAVTVGLPGVEPPAPPLPLPEFGVDALLRAETHLPTAVAAAHLPVDQVKASVDQLGRDAAAADTRLSAAQSILAQRSRESGNALKAVDEAEKQAKERREDDRRAAASAGEALIDEQRRQTIQGILRDSPRVPYKSGSTEPAWDAYWKAYWAEEKMARLWAARDELTTEIGPARDAFYKRPEPKLESERRPFFKQRGGLPDILTSLGRGLAPG